MVNKCKTCGKDVKEPYWYCYTCNQERKNKVTETPKAEETTPNQIDVEEVKEEKEFFDQKRNDIAIGQALNLAQNELIKSSSLDIDSLKEKTKKYYKLILELQKELI